MYLSIRKYHQILLRKIVVLQGKVIVIAVSLKMCHHHNNHHKNCAHVFRGH